VETLSVTKNDYGKDNNVEYNNKNDKKAELYQLCNKTYHNMISHKTQQNVVLHTTYAFLPTATEGHFPFSALTLLVG